MLKSDNFRCGADHDVWSSGDLDGGPGRVACQGTFPNCIKGSGSISFSSHHCHKYWPPIPMHIVVAQIVKNMLSYYLWLPCYMAAVLLLRASILYGSCIIMPCTW